MTVHALPRGAKTIASDPIFSAIEAHRLAWSEFSAEAAFFCKKRGGRDKPEFRAARDAYEAATSDLVLSAITTLPGLRTFTSYIADLQAYGGSRIGPCIYAIEVWHLSDAMATVAATLARQVSPLPRPDG